MPDKHGSTEATISFRTNNAAFTDGNGPSEVARILRELEDAIERDGNAEASGRIVDINGNRIGSYDIELPSEDEEGEEE
jgi:hypothetical protein